MFQQLLTCLGLSYCDEASHQVTMLASTCCLSMTFVAEHWLLQLCAILGKTAWSLRSVAAWLSFDVVSNWLVGENGLCMGPCGLPSGRTITVRSSKHIPSPATFSSRAKSARFSEGLVLSVPKSCELHASNQKISRKKVSCSDPAEHITTSYSENHEPGMIMNDPFFARMGLLAFKPT